jgi:hypothetical protein
MTPERRAEIQAYLITGPGQHPWKPHTGNGMLQDVWRELERVERLLEVQRDVSAHFFRELEEEKVALAATRRVLAATQASLVGALRRDLENQ